jgi:hypothetical protein
MKGGYLFFDIFKAIENYANWNTNIVNFIRVSDVNVKGNLFLEI